MNSAAPSAAASCRLRRVHLLIFSEPGSGSLWSLQPPLCIGKDAGTREDPQQWVAGLRGAAAFPPGPGRFCRQCTVPQYVGLSPSLAPSPECGPVLYQGPCPPSTVPIPHGAPCLAPGSVGRAGSRKGLPSAEFGEVETAKATATVLGLRPGPVPSASGDTFWPLPGLGAGRDGRAFRHGHGMRQHCDPTGRWDVTRGRRDLW